MTESKISIEDIEAFADDPNLERMVEIYNEHGCLVVRGLMSLYVNDLHRDIEQSHKSQLHSWMTL